MNAKAHVTGESRKQVKDKIHVNPEGNEKTDELAELGADMNNACRADWLASEMQSERDKVKRSIKYAVQFLGSGGALNDMQKV